MCRRCRRVFCLRLREFLRCSPGFGRRKPRPSRQRLCWRAVIPLPRDDIGSRFTHPQTWPTDAFADIPERQLPRIRRARFRIFQTSRGTCGHPLHTPHFRTQRVPYPARIPSTQRLLRIHAKTDSLLTRFFLHIAILETTGRQN